MSTQYFYRVPDGKVSGPLPLESIRTAVKVSRLPAGTLVSETQGEPWLDINLCLPRIETGRNPKLRECPTCGKDIAKSATKCVHCGKDFSSVQRMILLVILALLLCWFLGFFNFLPFLFR